MENKIYYIKGHCTTWRVEETDKGYLILNNKDRIIYYETLEKAKSAIRYAENAYIKAHPDAPIANRDIWCTHGILWVSDFDGNYY